jgi:hypothetical protein
MPTTPTEGLVTSPRQPRFSIPPMMNVPQLAALMGWSRHQARRWAIKHGIARQARPGCDIEIPLVALKTAFAEAWDSILEARALHVEHPSP